MKTSKTLYALIVLGVLSAILGSCKNENGRIWDINPICIYFTLTGENGEDLLDPSTPGSYAALPITATYEETTYLKDDPSHDPTSRAYLAIMKGIQTQKMYNGRYAIVFGELDGEETYKNAQVHMDWADGTKADVVTFSSKLKWIGGEPHGTRSFKLNGKEVAKDTPSPVIDIRKQALRAPSTNNDTSTDDGPEAVWDVGPIIFNICIVNKKGQDLLQANTPGHYKEDSVKAVFKGKEYWLNDPQYTGEGRAYMAQFTGLTRKKTNATSDTPYPLIFGELDGEKQYENENLILHWNSEERDTISFTARMEWKDNSPTFIRQYRLNGKEVAQGTSCPNINIVKDK